MGEAMGESVVTVTRGGAIIERRHRTRDAVDGTVKATVTSEEA